MKCHMHHCTHQELCSMDIGSNWPNRKYKQESMSWCLPCTSEYNNIRQIIQNVSWDKAAISSMNLVGRHATRPIFESRVICGARAREAF